MRALLIDPSARGLRRYRPFLNGACFVAFIVQWQAGHLSGHVAEIGIPCAMILEGAR